MLRAELVSRRMVDVDLDQNIAVVVDNGSRGVEGVQRIDLSTLQVKIDKEQVDVAGVSRQLPARPERYANVRSAGDPTPPYMVLAANPSRYEAATMTAVYRVTAHATTVPTCGAVVAGFGCCLVQKRSCLA
jgi:hypothetical protein